MTRVILATFFLAFTSSAISQDITVKNTFKNGETADAILVNENFTDLVAKVNAIVRKDDDQTITAVGLLALDKNTSSGRFNTALGSQALGNNESGTLNTATGHKALFTNVIGIQNSAFGALALQNNTADDNTAIGYMALFNNKTGNFNTGTGSKALFSNTVGIKNTASGAQALASNNGTQNTASGHEALKANVAGNLNTAVGAGSLVSNVDGSSNVAVGLYAGFYSKGSENTYVGTRAGDSVVTGSKNTAIGYGTGFGSTDLVNATAIGWNATVQADNTVRLGNAQVTAVRTSGEFFSSGISISSDARLKEDVASIATGLALVNDLNPVSYHRINSSSDDIEMGLLAQEVEETLAVHGLRNSGMVQQASEDAYRTVRYNDLLAPMIRAIQELDDAAEAKDQQIASLQEQLTEQQDSLLAMIATQQEQIVQLQNMVNQQFATR